MSANRLEVSMDKTELLWVGYDTIRTVSVSLSKADTFQ